MSIVSIRNLKRYANHGYNVLLTGRHGVGKTAIIKDVFGECFGEHNVHWKYFSASTLDPWVDFIGIPKNYTKDDGQEVFKIIPPEHFTGQEEIRAIFFDEINRAEEKTLNALMELIQFRSINGRVFPNLKCVWAAENPSDTEEYSVQPLDPAQKDRFHVQIKLPYELDKKYFTDKYGKDYSQIVCNWWTEDKNVSPRKLDTILEAYSVGFPIKDFSTDAKGLYELKYGLDSVSHMKSIKSVADTNDPDAIREYFTLDVIRKNEINLSDRKDIVSKIYDHMDGEVQDYIRRAFNYDPSSAGFAEKPKFSEEQKNFLDENVKYLESRRGFNYYNLNPIMKFAEKMGEIFDFSAEESAANHMPVGDYSDYLPAFLPFIFENSFKTNEIRDMVDRLKGAHSKQEYVKNMILVNIFALSMSKSKTTKKGFLEMNSNYNVIKRLSGNNDFKKEFRLSKPSLNAVMKEIREGKTVDSKKIMRVFY